MATVRATTAPIWCNRLRLIGEPAAFGNELYERLQQAVEDTKDNDRLTLVVALNYGSQADGSRTSLQQATASSVSSSLSRRRSAR